ncbi:MAG TPA: hypothetical protein VLV83_21320 [Acidobacteriota bacterium]|nr:hypothetical protein [Acidobacteriota bacterium]
MEDLERLAVIFGSVATGVGVLVAVVFGVVQARSASKDLRRSRHSTQLQALVAFDQLLENYHHVHTAVRPGGELEEKCNPSHQEKVDLERYMGLFERAKIFIDDGYLSPDHFRSLYGYRMRNLVKQPWVAEEKLRKRAGGWTYFIELHDSLYPNKAIGR